MVAGESRYRVEIDLSEQTLAVFEHDSVVFECDVSSAANGPGETAESFCTPRGWHEISEKIGADCPANTVFVGRKPTGEIYTRDLGRSAPERDWILTRILWLSGLEPGRNQGGGCDTKERYIYLHGTPDTTAMRKPGSHGCIRLRNDDVIRLFDTVPLGTRVHIHE